jgi:hypothetical protein
MEIAAARDEVLGQEDAVLAPPATAVSRQLHADQGCHVLLDTGTGDCTVVRTGHGELVVTVEPGRRIDKILVSRPWTVRVYRPSTSLPEAWEIALATELRDGDPPLYGAVTAKAVDVTGDGEDELVIAYRSEGTGMILDVDIVGTEPDGSPRILAHDQLYKGSVVFRHGHLVAWVPVYKRTDANCCPTWVERDVLVYRDGTFTVDAGPRIRARTVDVPASELA